MKVREHRKHRVKEKSSRKLSSELLALTIGVFLCLKKMNATVAVKQAPNKEDSVRIVPMISVYDKNSVSFFSHSSLLLLDQNSGGHLTQVLESKIRKKYKLELLHLLKYFFYERE